MLNVLVNSTAIFSCAYHSLMTRRDVLIELINQKFGGNQAEFARAIKRSPSQVHQWVSGHRNLGEAGARHIEMTLGLPQGYFDNKNIRQHTNVTTGPDLDKLTTVPVVGTTQAGPDKEWFELGYPPGYGEDYIDVPAKDPHAYALRVSGNSMEPRMHEGELVLVYPSWEAQPGDEVVVRMKNGEVMVKRLVYIRENRIGLDSISDRYSRIERKHDEIEFMHPVVGVIRPTAVKKRN